VHGVLSNRDGKSVRVTLKIHAEASRPNDLTLDYLRNISEPLETRRWCSRCTARNSNMGGRGVKWLVSFSPSSSLSSSSSPRTCSCNCRIKHFATTIYDTFAGAASAWLLRFISPRISPKKNFSADRLRFTANINRHLRSLYFVFVKILFSKVSFLVTVQQCLEQCPEKYIPCCISSHKYDCNFSLLEARCIQWWIQRYGKKTIFRCTYKLYLINKNQQIAVCWILENTENKRSYYTLRRF